MKKSSCITWVNKPYFLNICLARWRRPRLSAFLWGSLVFLPNSLLVSIMASVYSGLCCVAVSERPFSVGMWRIWLWYFGFVSFEPSGTDIKKSLVRWTWQSLNLIMLLTQQTKAVFMWLLGGCGKINTLNRHPVVCLFSAQLHAVHTQLWAAFTGHSKTNLCKSKYVDDWATAQSYFLCQAYWTQPAEHQTADEPGHKLGLHYRFAQT